MISIKLSGSYEEMGAQHGTALRDSGFTPPPVFPEQVGFVRQCEEIMAHFAPELLVEMKAFAEAARINYDDFAALTITAPFKQTAVPACTVFALTGDRTENGRLLFGRNYDFFHQFEGFSFHTYPNDHYASFGNCDIWIGREDGINEAGLFVAITATMLPGIQPGLTFWFLVRMILDRCGTVEEALALIEEVPHPQSRNFFIADKSGNVVVAEATIDGVAVRQPENGLLVVTNHVVSPRWQDKPAWVPPDSHPRFDRLQALFGDGKPVNKAQVVAALRDHEGLVCSHWPDGDGGTLWSLVGSPGVREIEMAGGSPCKNEYEKVTF